MQEYDVALKLLLRNSATLTMREVTGGATIVNWLDVELPKVQNLRADLLGETAAGDLFHVELQSANETTMPLRMAEYWLGILRLTGRFPRQIVLYVGEPPLRMETELRCADAWFRYHAIDIRSLDSEGLLESPHLGDNVIAILARLRDRRETVRRIIARIAELPSSGQGAAMTQLLILAGLRRLSGMVCHLRHKVAARESITWPALRQNTFNLNSAVRSPTISSEA